MVSNKNRKEKQEIITVYSRLSKTVKGSIIVKTPTKGSI